MGVYYGTVYDTYQVGREFQVPVVTGSTRGTWGLAPQSPPLLVQVLVRIPTQARAKAGKYT